MPIDDQLDGKLAAIHAFASQVEIRSYLEPDLISASARYWSRYGETRFAEPFEVVRESAAAGPSELTPAQGVVHGEDGVVAGVADRRPGAQPGALTATTREVPDAAR